MTNVLSPRNQGPFEFVISEDFTGQTTVGRENFTITVSGSTAVVVTTQTDAKTHGVLSSTINSGNSANRIAINLGIGCMMLGNGECCFRAKIKFTTSDTSTNRMMYLIGLGDTLNGEHTDGVYFMIDAIANANVLAKTSAASTRSQITTSVTAASLVNAWTEFMFIVNADATAVTFYINGNSVGTLNTTSTIPTAAGQTIAPILQYKRSTVNGTANAIVYTDYLYVQKHMLARI